MSKSRTTINPDRYYDLTARYVCGQVHRTIQNLKGSEIAKAKRATGLRLLGEGSDVIDAVASFSSLLAT